MGSVTREDKKMLLLCPFLNPKSRNGSPKNAHANLVRHTQKYRLYLTLSNRFAKLCHHIVT